MHNAPALTRRGLFFSPFKAVRDYSGPIVRHKKGKSMPTQHPHRAVGLCTSSKVYSALTELKNLEGYRTAKFVALMAQSLVEKGVISEQEVIALLDQVVD